VIGSVRGTVIDRTAAGEVLVEVAGIGYRLHVPTRQLGSFRVGTEVFAFTSHYVREDAVALYGFVTRDERDVFESLLGATGVGPKLALAILSVLGPDDLRRVLVDDDADALCAIPGVGKKTAQRLLLELKSRLAVPDLEVVRDGGVRSARAEVRDALAGLGYGPDEIRSLLAEVDPGDDESPEVVLREALRVAASERAWPTRPPEPGAQRRA
jgi:Holliday junction DNA helicase RuvA